MYPRSSITSLPLELLLMITEELDPLDQMSLKITNRHFNNMIPRHDDYALDEIQSLLYMHRGWSKQTIPGTNIRISKSRPLRPFLACMCCNRLRSSLNFDDDNVLRQPELRVPHHMPKGARFIAKLSDEQRMCIECRLKMMDYEPLSEITIEGFDHVVCGCKVGAYNVWPRSMFCMPKCCRDKVRAREDAEDEEDEENEQGKENEEDEENEDVDEPRDSLIIHGYLGSIGIVAFD